MARPGDGGADGGCGLASAQTVLAGLSDRRMAGSSHMRATATRGTRPTTGLLGAGPHPSPLALETPHTLLLPLGSHLAEEGTNRKDERITRVGLLDGVSRRRAR